MDKNKTLLRHRCVTEQELKTRRQGMIHNAIPQYSQSPSKASSLNQERRGVNNNTGLRGPALKDSSFKPDFSMITGMQAKFKQVKTLELIKKFKQNLFRVTVPLQVPQHVEDLYLQQYYSEEAAPPHEGWAHTRLDVICWDILSMLITVVLIFELTASISLRIGMSYRAYIYLLWVFVTAIYKNNVKVFMNERIILYKHELRQNYLREQFAEDLIVVVLVFLEAAEIETGIFKILCFIKGRQVLRTFQKLQNILLMSNNARHIWSFIKNLALNFVVSHVVALVLLEMALLSQNSNWIVTKGLENKPWYQVYIWTYYWATTMILTIGFGDFVPSNYKEAVVVTMAEMLGSIVLAYTVSSFGDLIRKYHMEDQKKQNSLNIMSRYIQEYDVPYELQVEVKKSFRNLSTVAKEFNVVQQNAVINELPLYLKQNLLENLYSRKLKHICYFGKLYWKTISSIALCLEKKVYHERQKVIPEKTLPSSIYFLYKGEVHALVSLNKTKPLLIQKYMFNQGSFVMFGFKELLSGSFSSPCYETAAISTLYQLSVSNFYRILAESPRQKEIYLALKDQRMQGLVEEEVNSVECPVCPFRKHSLLECSKFHYIPLRKMIITDYIREINGHSNYRNQIPVKRHNYGKVNSRECHLNLQAHQEMVEIEIEPEKYIDKQQCSTPTSGGGPSFKKKPSLQSAIYAKVQSIVGVRTDFEDDPSDEKQAMGWEIDRVREYMVYNKNYNVSQVLEEYHAVVMPFF